MNGLADPRMLVSAVAIATMLATSISGQQSPPQFGGSYASLDSRRQHYVDDWVSRFTVVTGKKIAPAEFYDGIIRFSAKTTFEAITNALMTTALTDASGKDLGDALALVEQVDGVRGKVLGASGDRQFRMDEVKLPWYIDLLNINLNNTDLNESRRRIKMLADAFRKDGTRITENLDFSEVSA